MLDSSKLKYKPFPDSRTVSLQGSRQKLFATDGNGKKYVVKHVFMHNAANEFVGCWLADKLQVPAPKAYLLSPDCRLSSQYAVAIEYLGKLSDIPADISPFHNDIAGIYALNELIYQEDKVQISFFDNHIATYDFSESFEITEWDQFMLIMKKAPYLAKTSAGTRKECVRNYLSSVKFNNTSIADKCGIGREQFRQIQIETAMRVLKITDENIESVVNELALMYDSPIPEYYRFCIEQIREHVRTTFS